MKITQLDHKPRKGERIGFGEFTGNSMDVKPPAKSTAIVVSISETNPNLCWILSDGQRDAQPFIWWFEREQMHNKLAHVFDETKPEHKRFRLIDDRNGSDPLSGPVNGANVYIAAYPVPMKDQKHPRDLEIGESAICKYSLSGSTGVYRVRRLDDEEPTS
jgi:hypothetical protein